jgi:FkbM family methyltransferase
VTQFIDIMLRRLKSMSRGVTRRLAMAPLQLVTGRLRAEAIEVLSERMVTTIETTKGRIRFFSASPLLAARAQNLLTKEPDMISWIDRFPDGSVFWDVGANVGVFSLYAAATRNLSVLSFEPLAANFHVLAKNIQLNGFSERVTAYCVALAGATELGVLNMESAAMGAALSHFGQPGEMSRYCSRGTDGYVHGMLGFRVDDFIDQFHPPFPNYLKMDVDGLEWAILQGAKSTLRDTRLRAVMAELSLSDQEERDQAVSLLEASGLSFVSHGDIQGTEEGKAANHLFERRTCG